MFCVQTEPGICLELAAGSQQAMAGLGNLPEGEFSVASGERGGAVDDMLRGGGEALGAAPGRSWGEDRGDCGKARDSTAPSHYSTVLPKHIKIPPNDFCMADCPCFGQCGSSDTMGS